MNIGGYCPPGMWKREVQRAKVEQAKRELAEKVLKAHSKEAVENSDELVKKTEQKLTNTKKMLASKNQN